MLTLDELKELYQNDLNANKISLNEYKEAKRYYHGDQLREIDKQTILNRNQTPIIENIFKMIINKILGYKAQSVSEIRVSGRQKEDKNLAYLLNDLLKVFSHSSFYNKEMNKKDYELIFGLAVCELWVKEDSEKNRFITLKTLNAKSFLIDAYSKDLNANDARRFHKRLDMDYYEARALFKKELENNQNSVDKRVGIVETWIKEGGVFNRYIWQDKAILAYEKSPFKNGMHPFCISKFQIDEDNKWYGLFRDIKPMQDYINFAENKMGNMLGSFKALFEADAVSGSASEFVEALSIDNAVVKVAPNSLRDNKIQFINQHNNINALSVKANEKRNLAKILSGLNDEFLGIANNRQSGDAIAQRKEAGLMGLQEFLNKSDDLDRLIFRKAMDLMQMYFTKKQVFKIVDKDRGERYFSINDREENAIKIGAFDLEYKSQVKTASNEERFVQWSEILKSLQQTQPQLASELLPLILEDIDSPIVEKVKEVIAQVKEAQASRQNDTLAQLQQQKMILELQKDEAEIKERQAKAGKYTAQGMLAHKISEDENKQSMQKGGQDLR
ncbi:portal protein [Campylobacter felis]|uniref:Portal protein n=1 Tax=Campylobacter felis TaxID=2974565 RepID=A0ABT7I5W5_9BACT|nr:portal protein [Campylobacter upsaliensis]MDL0109102.1 portal protein [Campylobacter felis]MDL0147653.1 portal protein [Campylobacter felis]